MSTDDIDRTYKEYAIFNVPLQRIVKTLPAFPIGHEEEVLEDYLYGALNYGVIRDDLVIMQRTVHKVVTYGEWEDYEGKK